MYNFTYRSRVVHFSFYICVVFRDKVLKNKESASLHLTLLRKEMMDLKRRKERLPKLKCKRKKGHRKQDHTHKIQHLETEGDFQKA